MPHFDTIKINNFVKNCEKSRNCLLQAISPFLTMFSTLYGTYFSFQMHFNPFPHDKILDHTKLKAFADDKLNVTKIVISVFDRVKNMVGKGEIACSSNCSFSYNSFKRLHSQTRQKVSLCENGLKCHLQFVSIWTSLKFCCLVMG